MGCCISKSKSSKGKACDSPTLNARPVQAAEVRRRGRQSYASSSVASCDTACLPSKGLTPSSHGTPDSTIRFNGAGDALNSKGRMVGRSKLPSAACMWVC
ncbi:hypothetical protein NLG97_g8062 [Lecanicillium saksenae]|uniref:Uncharacterized protein n=1 Tax=Lecanicillium saksenae TaxID=468837 RepID=A0ACC1QK37_9HYPO|nr:hypothetical protein NLG97_g8062 [Lecanicillium saksenae]